MACSLGQTDLKIAKDEFHSEWLSGWCQLKQWNQFLFFGDINIRSLFAKAVPERRDTSKPGPLMQKLMKP